MNNDEALSSVRRVVERHAFLQVLVRVKEDHPVLSAVIDFWLEELQEKPELFYDVCEEMTPADNVHEHCLMTLLDGLLEGFTDEMEDPRAVAAVEVLEDIGKYLPMSA